jgi:hypothetical protein
MSISGTETYDQCVYDVGSTLGDETLNGSITFAEILDATPTIIAYQGSIDAVVDGMTVHEDMNYALVGGEITYSVDVSDGNVLVQESASWDTTTQSGTFTVVDRSGSWSCSLSNGTGTCSGTQGSITVTS